MTHLFYLYISFIVRILNLIEKRLVGSSETFTLSMSPQSQISTKNEVDKGNVSICADRILKLKEQKEYLYCHVRFSVINHNLFSYII